MQVCQQPGTAQELAETLGKFAAENTPVTVTGGGTKLRWGGPVAQSGARLSTASLNRVIDYEPKDLTIAVEAGIRYADLRNLLAENRQMIPLDPPYAEGATIGGILAANHSGPRRRLYGTARDLVIGMHFATTEGRIIQSGGMVVKNVAGLDMGKLLIGSWGTLGVITRVNFKLIPADRTRRTFVCRFPSLAEAIAERNRLLEGVLQPAAMDLLNPAAAARIGREDWLLAIAAGGSQALIDRYSRELPDTEVLEGEAETAFWSGIEDFAPRFLDEHPSGAVVRATAPLRDLSSMLEDHWGPALARAANGVAYLFHPELPLRIAPPTGTWPAPGIHAVLEAGPESRATVEQWPDPGSAFPVMQRVKQMLDPQGILNPGRLYGRI